MFGKNYIFCITALCVLAQMTTVNAGLCEILDRLLSRNSATHISKLSQEDMHIMHLWNCKATFSNAYTLSNYLSNARACHKGNSYQNLLQSDGSFTTSVRINFPFFLLDQNDANSWILYLLKCSEGLKIVKKSPGFGPRISQDGMHYMDYDETKYCDINYHTERLNNIVNDIHKNSWKALRDNAIAADPNLKNTVGLEKLLQNINNYYDNKLKPQTWRESIFGISDQKKSTINSTRKKACEYTAREYRYYNNVLPKILPTTPGPITDKNTCTLKNRSWPLCTSCLTSIETNYQHDSLNQSLDYANKSYNNVNQPYYEFIQKNRNNKPVDYTDLNRLYEAYQLLYDLKEYNYLFTEEPSNKAPDYHSKYIDIAELQKARMQISENKKNPEVYVSITSGRSYSLQPCNAALNISWEELSPSDRLHFYKHVPHYNNNKDWLPLHKTLAKLQSKQNLYQHEINTSLNTRVQDLLTTLHE